jgi:hypothetical protein
MKRLKSYFSAVVVYHQNASQSKHICSSLKFGLVMPGSLNRFEIFTIVMMMIFWVSVPCSVAGRCFGETYCLHLQGWSTKARKWTAYIVLQEVS